MAKKAHNRKNRVGEKFGRMTVVSYVAKRAFYQKNTTKCLCLCDCGRLKIVNVGSLVTGNTTSCGCYATEGIVRKNSKHEKTGTRVYGIWQGMLNRCRNPKTLMFHRYGGRGIKVCKKWNSFEIFYKDMGDPPTNQHQIDRINNDGNYEKTNCKWSTRAEQSLNKSTNRVLELDGISKPMCEWARELQIDQASLRERLEKWSLRDALTRPKKIIKHILDKR